MVPARTRYDDRISVQRGITAMATTLSATTVQITEISTAKAFLIFSYYATGSTVSNRIAGVITDSTSITFNRYQSGYSASISWQVCEWNVTDSFNT